MTAEQAIARSISHNEIVHLAWDLDTYTNLIIESDDSVEANGTIEIWGTDDDGNEWRVHMCAEAADITPDAPISANERALARADYDVCC